jgi:hypothetical protein
MRMAAQSSIKGINSLGEMFDKGESVNSLALIYFRSWIRNPWANY